ncbi:hypothetical protein [Amycolatopsis sp. NPDC051372]|uniref:hypothetical protein n=1 Tax=unclassified Amycolatopsis TaxID=2618356 RepID=UPI00341F8F7C
MTEFEAERRTVGAADRASQHLSAVLLAAAATTAAVVAGLVLVLFVVLWALPSGALRRRD